MIKQYKLSMVLVLIVGLLALVSNVNATGYMNGANWTGIDNIWDSLGLSYLKNSSLLSGGNITLTKYANGSVTISSAGGSVSGMSNPAIADLNMGNYNITGLGQNESYSYFIWTDGVNYYAKNGNTGKVDYSGTNAGTILNSAIGTGNKNIVVGIGMFEVGDTIIDLKSNTRINGVGKTLTIFNFSGIESNGYFRSTDYNNIEIGNLKITGTGGIYIAPNRVNITNIYLHDIIGTVEGIHLSFIQAYTTQAIISNYTIERVDCIDSKTSCFLNRGWNSGGGGETPNIELLDNVHWIDIKAINAGKDTPRFNEWSTGIDLSENVPLSNFYLTGCYASGSWRGGVYTEIATSYRNVIISNCISEGNGLSTGSYGAGYYLSSGVQLYDSISRNNNFAGIVLVNTGAASGGDSDIILNNVHEYNSSTYKEYPGIGGGYYILLNGGNVFISDSSTTNSQSWGVDIENAGGIFIKNFIIKNPRGGTNVGALTRSVNNIIGVSKGVPEIYPVNDSRIELTIIGGNQTFADVYFEGNHRTTLTGSINSTNASYSVYLAGGDNVTVDLSYANRGTWVCTGTWGQTALSYVSTNYDFKSLPSNPSWANRAGDQFYNTTSNIQQLYTGSSWDWFLMPSKVFAGANTTVTNNNNNGSITISSTGGSGCGSDCPNATVAAMSATWNKTSLPFTIENGTNVIGSDYSNFFTTGFAGTLTKFISHSTQTGSINMSFWNASDSNSYIGSVAIAAGTDASTVLSYPFADETRIMFNISGAVTDIKQVGLTIKATKS